MLKSYATLLSAGLLLAAGLTGATAALQPVALRCEYLENPLGVEAAPPRLSWQVESAQRGQRQTACHILVASSLEKLGAAKGDLWDSGKLTNSETVNIPYAGQPLASGQRCFWKVKAWDKDGAATDWSPSGSWTMGLLQAGDWKADWISFRDTTALHTNRSALYLPPARHYRKSFQAQKSVQRATLYATALGIFELQLNGQRVGEAAFEPGWSDYRKRAYYRTHDVTRLVQSGANTLGAIVADGWYAGYVGYAKLVGYGPDKTGRNLYGKTPALLAQLDLEYTDGSREIVGTDPTWEVTGDGPFREADIIMGESYDARKELPGWSGGPKPAGTASAAAWEPAILAAANGRTTATFYDPLGPREVQLGFVKPARLQAYPGPAIRVCEELKARRLTEPNPGVYIFDLGENFAGVARFRIKGQTGQKILFRYGEMLHPDGRLMTENLRAARASDVYVCRGDAGGETWTPRFTYHGFQFVELTGLSEKPALEAVTGLVQHSDTPLVGNFACSDEVMTQFFRNARRTQLANFFELPTDCPQRDERLGWMGDAQIYARTASYIADVSAFFTKWLEDVEEAQRDSGAYPDYAPYPMAHGAPGQTWGTAWTDAGILCPWTMWKVYGDTRLLERHWASMTRFMEWRRQRAPDFRGQKDGNSWGDWLNVNESTPLEFIDAAYFKLDAMVMAQMARALGRTNESESYHKLQSDIAAQFGRDYLLEDGTLKVNTQTAYVLTLAFNLTAQTNRPALATRLAGMIAKNDARMATGFLGTKHLLPALTENGQNDLACRLFQSRRFPSWGYEVVNGATSVWERWDSYTKEHGFNGAGGEQNAAMNSFSHYSFGAVMQWAFQELAGIDTYGPGFKWLVLRPNPPTPGSNPEQPAIHWVTAEYGSAHGRIASAWKRLPAGLELNVTIPANTEATVVLPAQAADEVTESGQPLTQAEGVKFLRGEGGRIALTVESGSYSFLVRADK